jgi:hypothetical protein
MAGARKRTTGLPVRTTINYASRFPEQRPCWWLDFRPIKPTGPGGSRLNQPGLVCRTWLAVGHRPAMGKTRLLGRVPRWTRAIVNFGDTLARYQHQSERKTVVTSWPEQSTFAITRLHSGVGLPDVSQPIPEEAAIHVSIAIKPVRLRSYELYIDDRRIEVPFRPGSCVTMHFPAAELEI